MSKGTQLSCVKYSLQNVIDWQFQVTNVVRLLDKMLSGAEVAVMSHHNISYISFTWYFIWALILECIMSNNFLYCVFIDSFFLGWLFSDKLYLWAYAAMCKYWYVYMWNIAQRSDWLNFVHHQYLIQLFIYVPIFSSCDYGEGFFPPH